MDLSVNEIVDVLDGKMLGCQDIGELIVNRFSIDSRTIKKGALFFAIRGKNYNGADFVEMAIRKGSPLAVIERSQVDNITERKNLIIVKDSTKALHNLALYVRKRASGLRFIGITGSAGKTTAKEMTYSLLKDSFKTAKTEGNLNNLYGLPLCLLTIKGDEELFVGEMGMSIPGELMKLVAIANPNVGVLLNVHPVHTVNFKSIEEVARAKAELFENMIIDGIAIYNSDNKWSREIGEKYQGRKITFGIIHKSDVMAEKIRYRGFEGTAVTLTINGSQYEVNIPRYGLGNIYNFLSAASVAYAMGVDAGEYNWRIQEMALANGRSNVLKLKENITVLDDSYNSNPVAMEMLLGFLQRYRNEGRKVVIAGDMLELGKKELQEHLRIGKVIAKSDIDLLVTVGSLSRKMIEGALEEGMKKNQIEHFETAEEAASRIEDLIKKDDIVLVKGSHGIHTEKVVEKLKSAFK
jgi:UDP-N-acetylmuramoyl-tripeptide--D-alanyl-D-alanine ligase